jgi:uncharacterized protein YbjT (DUF2867 family)
MVKAALAAPVDGMIEIAGPERLKLSGLIANFLQAIADPRHVVADPQARYFGALLDDASLVPGAAAHLGSTHYESWMAQSATVKAGEHVDAAETVLITPSMN